MSVKSRDAPEHPSVEKHLKMYREFWDLPIETRKKIEEFVRIQAPIYAEAKDNDHAFRSACMAVMVEWRKEGKL